MLIPNEDKNQMGRQIEGNQISVPTKFPNLLYLFKTEIDRKTRSSQKYN